VTAPHLFRVLMPSRNLAESRQFYRTIFATQGSPVSDGRHYFDLGGTILACFDPRADGDGYDAKSNPEYIYIAVDDLEEIFKRCRKAGAQFSGEVLAGDPMGEVATRPWGERSFYITDPTGNPVCFVDAGTKFIGQ